MQEDHFRPLDISDLERVQRFRIAGYGASVSDALWHLETYAKENAERDELARGLPINEVYRRFGVL